MTFLRSFSSTQPPHHLSAMLFSNSATRIVKKNNDEKQIKVFIPYVPINVVVYWHILRQKRENRYHCSVLLQHGTSHVLIQNDIYFFNLGFVKIVKSLMLKTNDRSEQVPNRYHCTSTPSILPEYNQSCIDPTSTNSRWICERIGHEQLIKHHRQKTDPFN